MRAELRFHRTAAGPAGAVRTAPGCRPSCGRSSWTDAQTSAYRCREMTWSWYSGDSSQK